MFKIFSKLVLTLLISIFIIISFSFCYATEEVVTTSTPEQSEISATNSEESEEVSEAPANHYGDLYLCKKDVDISNTIIYGNVYILADNIQIVNTQIEGNLFILANNVYLKEDTFINSTAYISAENIYFISNAASRYLYAYSSNKFEMDYDSFVISDAKIKAGTTNITSAIGRDLNLVSNNINLSNEDKKAIIYGKFNYSSPTEITIPEGVLAENGEITYTPLKISSNSVINIIISLFACILTTIVIYFIIIKLTPTISTKLEEQPNLFMRLLKSLGIGALSFIIITVSLILLVLTKIGLTLAFILFLLFALLCSIAVPVLSITIANVLKKLLNLEKKSIYFLVLTLLSITFYGLTLIPLIGIVLNIIIKITSIGLILFNFLLHKEFTDEEKIAIEEAKKQVKEDKEKRKQERIEAKIAKKLEKENKKNENNL